MKTIFFLLSFIPFISMEVNAQSDSLTSKDSIPAVTATIPDSVNIIAWGPWSYDPHMIQIDWSKILVAIPAFESPYTLKGAKKDIKSGKPVILFHGGFGGMPDFSSEADKNFQRKYGVEFFCQGCSRMPNDDQEGYNQVIFAYLDKKYGEGWRYELSEGAVGFEEPEKRMISQCKSTAELTSPLAMQLANPKGIDSQSINPETETSIWWYILPTSGFALLLSLYFIKKKKDS
jgi:hypothetical protein